ncbi:Kelch domain-containing protein [Schistosoma japonicum]|uniref:Kelch domain-containing protein n=1 Tax=Schistosoma japonicum TaxID=6182 RepID=A0A4Z2D0C6_SCHJA|nr:Kelch domain-containing protein [Schistosoma japonicum]
MPKRCSLQWICVVNNTIGPLLQNHAGAIVKGVFYIHGGITVNATLCKRPSNRFYKIQIYPDVGQWVEITSPDSPSLSQHVCLVFKDRYLIFIGGWNGRIRIPGIHTYDTQSNSWLPPALEEPLLTGFPQGAGLSAHSAQAFRSLNDNENKFSAIIIGRDGSLRIQRKAGNIYLLYGDLIDADSPQQRIKYVYYEADSNLSASSRSYHTSTAIAPCTLITIGGCKSNSFDLLKWKITHKNKKEQYNWPGLLDYPLISCSAVTDFVKSIEQQKLDLIQLVPSHQNGWRGHCVVPGVGGLFIGTGESFDALKHGPLNSAYLLKYDENDNNVKPTVYEIGTIDEPRAYSVTSICRIDGTAWLHGGLGPDGKTMGTLMKLIKVD